MNNIKILIFLFAVFLASEADASRFFNLTGWFDTGFSIGHRRHRVREREAVYRTEVENPDLLNVAEQVTRHHGRRHHGAHGH